MFLLNDRERPQLARRRRSGVDVKHPLRMAALDASIGWKVSLQVSLREGPESAA